MRFYHLAISSALLIAAGCRPQTPSNVEQKNSNMKDTVVYVKDPHSYSEPTDAVVKHLNLNLDVSFEKKMLSGSATWSIENRGGADKIIFDTHNLVIEKVITETDGSELPFTLGENDPILGQPLTIGITPETIQITIYYHTTDSALAVQWLNPDQTAGKKHPFMFTQSQAILARTWIPCQDSPGIRFDYEATITVPDGYLALMSAQNPTEKNKENTYKFLNPCPIPSYLMALAVGDIGFKPVGKRTGIYAEPVMLDKAVYEFGEMEQMVEAAEKLYGPYAWGRYDVLVLPPSFPFGGMENPMLTFATPTVIAGDRSLTSLIAHELAHSWSGNLVTNATWNDFWLNEGFTVYFERRIMESVYGRSYAEMLAALGYGDVEFTIRDFTENGHPEYTRLKLELDGQDPDEGMNDVAYEKGYLLLCAMEDAVGRDAFDTFLIKYFETYRFRSITTEQFIEYVHQNLLKPGSEAERKVGMEKWIYEPGFPESFKGIKESERFKNVKAEADQYLAGGSVNDINTREWTSHEWQQFLRIMMDTLTLEQMKALDAKFDFTHSGNSEIAALWFEASVDHNYEPAYGQLERFLTEVGRRKFLTPLYKALMRNPNTQALGKKIYARARKNYHAVSVNTIDKIVGYEEK